jgi:membrane fusion protein, multidrug efflux system
MRSTLACTAAALLALAACSKPAEKMGMPPPPPVDVAVVPTMPVTPHIELTARIAAKAMVDVRAQVRGQVAEVLVADGAMVAAGDVLLRIDAKPFQAAVDRAQAQIAVADAAAALAAAQLRRHEDVAAHDPEAVSAEAGDRLRAQVADSAAQRAAAEAALTSARIDLGYATVTAPIAGRLGRIGATVGNLVDAGTPVIVSIVQDNPVDVVMALDEATAAAVSALTQTGPVEIAVGRAGSTGYQDRATLAWIAPTVDPATGTREARATLAVAAAPGGFARVRIPTGPQADRPVIDEQAVFAMQTMRLVLTLAPGDTVAPRPVRLGQRLPGGLRVVEDGLAPGEQILIHPAFPRVLPGSTVVPQAVSMEPAVRSAAQQAAAAPADPAPATAEPAPAPSDASASGAATQAAP